MQIHTKKKSVWASDLNQFEHEDSMRWCYGGGHQQGKGPTATKPQKQHAFAAGISGMFKGDNGTGILKKDALNKEHARLYPNSAGTSKTAAPQKKNVSSTGTTTPAAPTGSAGSRTKRRSSLRIASPSAGGTGGGGVGINTANNY